MAADLAGGDSIHTTTGMVIATIPLADTESNLGGGANAPSTFLENSMLDNSNLREPFDVSSIEEEVSTLVGNRGTEPYAPAFRRLNSGTGRLLPKPTLEDSAEVVAAAGAEDATHDPVNHPKHYTSHPSGIECIIITRWMNFNLGNVVKYLWRCDDKGATIEDLKKARWYLDDEITRLEQLANG